MKRLTIIMILIFHVLAITRILGELFLGDLSQDVTIGNRASLCIHDIMILLTVYFTLFLVFLFDKKKLFPNK